MSNDFSISSSFSIGKHFRDFIKQEIKQGRYKTGSEVMRAGLRLLEQEEHRWKTAHPGQKRKSTQPFDTDNDNPGVEESPPP